eukprot:gnl/TRDRNA2_/TRDRNA2_37675_c0_seq1.p1 gnl/TRDRNA2_/TRDRNA2_37675_c0~~gnl/TRDRNA2_/TRDRNA2_37675_c0_seq1.p1  ORF type:complete len:274 (-),score=98.18 gnl/TRDRNA2_/TRDRNA2_37675_c0_seq1:262-1032(-)
MSNKMMDTPPKTMDISKSRVFQAYLAKKPESAYFMWLKDNREKIARTLPSGQQSTSNVSKKCGEVWKALPEAQKAPYEKKAQAANDTHKKLAETDAGKAAKADMKAEVEAKKGGMNVEEHKATVETANKVKRPQTAYFLWLNGNRESIAADIGSNKFGEVTKKAAEIWKALKPEEKAPWEKQAADAKAEFDKFKKTAEGKAVLEAKKTLAKRKKELNAKKATKKARGQAVKQKDNQKEEGHHTQEEEQEEEEENDE